MKKFIAITLTVVSFQLSGLQAVNAHGGGLDWQGGHNCRVGSCAGTYHCHQPRAGSCAPSSSLPKKKPLATKSISVECILQADENLSRNQIAMIQLKLANLGYQPGTRDGGYGNSTIKALNKFETDYDLAKSNREVIQVESLTELGAMC
jgi:hypothetical protein